jgi:hypothetical protein
MEIFTPKEHSMTKTTTKLLAMKFTFPCPLVKNLNKRTNFPLNCFGQIFYKKKEMAPSVYALYILNKSGGVIYYQSFHKDAPKLGLNDYLRLGSMFHG